MTTPFGGGPPTVPGSSPHVTAATYRPPQPPAPRRSRTRRWSTGVLVGLVVVVAATAAYGWFLAARWQSRAERSEREYRRVAGALDISESDVVSLEKRQRELAAEKAQLEDERTALAKEKDAVEETLDDVAEIAKAYRACSAAYRAVIDDLASNQVTDSTVTKANEADTICQRANALVAQLQ